MGAIVSESQMNTISEYVQSAREEGAEVFQPELPLPPHGLFYPPTLITKIQTISKCVREEVGCLFVGCINKAFFLPLLLRDCKIIEEKIFKKASERN